jgi:hypothetical protein
MARADKEAVSPELSITTELRQTFAWFDLLVARAKYLATQALQEKCRARGPELSIGQLMVAHNDLENLRRELNDLEEKYGKAHGKLATHWGYTGIEKISSNLGETNFSEKFKIALDIKALKGSLPPKTWKRILVLVPDPVLLLNLAEQDPKIQDVIKKAVHVIPQLSITPPSSRTPKSGKIKSKQRRRKKQ